MIDQEQNKREINSELAGMAGMGVGYGAGALAVNPLGTLKENIIIKHHNPRVPMYRNRYESLRAIRDIYNGDLTWDDIEDEIKPELKEMYEKNQDLLRNEEAFEANLRQWNEKRWMKTPNTKRNRWLPNKESLEHRGAKWSGIGGMIGTYGLLHYMNQKNQENKENEE